MMAWTKAQIAAGVVVVAAIGGTGGTLAIRSALAQDRANAKLTDAAEDKPTSATKLDKAACTSKPACAGRGHIS